MSKWAAIKAELEANPGDYDDLGHSAAAAVMAAKTQPAADPQPVSNAKYLVWLAGNARRDKLAVAAASHASEDVRTLAQLALDMALREDIEYKREDHKPMLDSLVLGGVLDEATDGDVSALDDLADGTEQSFPEASAYGVMKARKEIAAQ